MKTLQQIYDFCKLNSIFRVYADLPEQFKMSHRDYKYYHNSLSKTYDRSRAGTFLFGAAMGELRNFLGTDKDRVYVFINPETYEISDKGYKCMYAVARITGQGVSITFTHPFKIGYFGYHDVIFIARSHKEFTKEGIRDEVVKYIDKNVLLPKGRYRDYQIKLGVKKEEFKTHYLIEKKIEHERAEFEHYDMLEYYRTMNDISFDDSYNILQSLGLFSDLDMDDMEREDTAYKFMNMCNKQSQLSL